MKSSLFSTHHTNLSFFVKFFFGRIIENSGFDRKEGGQPGEIVKFRAFTHGLVRGGVETRNQNSFSDIT